MTESSAPAPAPDSSAHESGGQSDAASDPRDTDHPAGDEQADANVENEPAG